MKPSTPFRRVWLAPLVIAFFTAGGLFTALLGDGVWNTLSWIALAIPVASAIWIFSRHDAT
jgi:hypothetical protein